MPERLTQAEIMALVSEREASDVYGAMWTAMDKDWACITASAKWVSGLMPTYLQGFPKDYVPKVPPIAKKGLELFRNSVMSGEEPEVKVPLPQGMRTSKSMEARRKAMEDFDRAWIYNVATRPGINPFVDILNKSGGLGMGGISAAFDFEKWPKKPTEETEEALKKYEKDKNCFPWKVTVIHPKGFMPDPWRDPPEDYVIKDKISAVVAQRQYPKLEFSKEGKLERVQYISKEQYCVYIGGQAAVEVDNPMGMLWIETVWSGIGELNADNEFEFLGQGIIRNTRDIIALIVKALNRADIVADDAAFTPLHITAPTTPEAIAAAGELEYGPDKTWATADTVKVAVLPKIPLNDQSVWTYEQTKMWAEMAFGATVLSGSAPNDPATGLIKNVSLAEAPYRPIRINAEQAWANILRMVHKFIKEELGEDELSLSYKDGATVTLRAEDIIDDCPVVINYKPPTDEERAFNAARDEQLLALHMISPQEFRRRQGIDDDPEETQRIIEGLLMYHDLVIGASAQAIANQINPQPVEQPVQPEVSLAAPGPAQNGAQPAPVVTSNQQLAQNQADKMYAVPLRARQ